MKMYGKAQIDKPNSVFPVHSREQERQSFLLAALRSTAHSLFQPELEVNEMRPTRKSDDTSRIGPVTPVGMAGMFPYSVLLRMGFVEHPVLPPGR
jgi:hypothetical protein